MIRATATIADGRLVIDDPMGWRMKLSEAKPGHGVLTYEPDRTVRSSQANRYWWGVIVDTFRDIWSRGRVTAGLPPYTREETHSVLVQVLAGSEPGPLAGSVLHLPTRAMDTAQFSALIDGARALAWDQYQLNIPAPGDRWEVSL